MPVSAPHRSLVPLLLSALATGQACTLGIVVGDNPADETTTAASTGAATTIPDPTTSTGAPLPAVCGDGLVADGEVCDDGDDDPHDGCDASCARTGVLEWTFEHHDGPTGENAAIAVAVDGAGTIVFLGARDDGTTVSALAPDGTELWQRALTDISYFSLAIDDADRIYLGGMRGTVRCLAPGGADLWAVDDLENGVSEVRGLALAPDALYAVGTEVDAEKRLHLVLRRHDLAAGAVVWKTMTPDDIAALNGTGVALSGSDIVAVGWGAVEDVMGPMTLQAVVTAFSASGELLAIEWGEVGRAWHAVAPIGQDGDLVLTGWGPTDDIVVRRIGPDRAAKWTHIDDALDASWGNAVAVGPGEAILVAGHASTHPHRSLVRRHTGAGDLVWTSVFDNPLELTLDTANAVAFGPGFIVAVGRETVSADDPHITKLWVRRFSAD